MIETIYIVLIAFLAIACLWYKIIAELEERRSNELQEELEVLNVKYNAIKMKYKRKKELIEIQDKLLQEKN